MDFNKFENNVSVYTGKVKDKFLVINGATVALNTKVTDNEVDISTLRSDLNDVSGRLDEKVFILGRADENINSSISDIRADVSTLRAYVYEQFDTESTGITNNLNEVNSSISGIKSDISTLQNADTSINTWILNQNNLVGTPDDPSTANTLYGMLKALKAQVDENEEVVAAALVDLNSRIP